jgi:hypothetical protein
LEWLAFSRNFGAFFAESNSRSVDRPECLKGRIDEWPYCRAREIVAIRGAKTGKRDAMRTTVLTALFTAALAASPTLGDELDDARSFARDAGDWDGDIVNENDFRYGRSDGFNDYGAFGQPYAGPRRKWGYVRSNSGVPPRDELLQMDYRQLRQVAGAASADFDRWLSGIPAGEFWRKHFDSVRAAELFTSEENLPPTVEEGEETARILDIFDRAVAEPDLNDITRMASARTLHSVLRELTTPPDQRRVRQLSFNARMLNRALDNVATGVTWQRYLALPDGVIAAIDRPPGEIGTRPELDSEALSRILQRYDSVSQNEEYNAIASLPEFQATHQSLAELVNPPPIEVAEEIPPPDVETR